MSSRGQVYLIALILIFLGLGATAYKYQVLGFPLTPGKERVIWNIDAEIRFSGDGNPATVRFALPRKQEGWAALDERFSSPGYGFAIVREEDGRYAEWTTREAEGAQSLFYSAEVYADSREQGLSETVEADPVRDLSLDYSASELAAIQSIVKAVTAISATPESFTRQLLLLRQQAGSAVQQEMDMLKRSHKTQSAEIKVALDILNQASVTARRVVGLYLKDGLRKAQATHFLEIHDGEDWVLFDLQTGAIADPEKLLLWQRGGSLLEVAGGSDSSVRFSVSENTMSSRMIAVMAGGAEHAALVDFSIYSLPIQIQNIFKMLLLVPIGALVVVVMRLVVGVSTAGTFMPILIAIAFIQTQLVMGLVMFVMVVSIGLWIRSYLSRLNLLMVARIAAVIIVVIFIMAGMSILSYKLGIVEALTITFFPMIVLSWTIERMSVLWEESGPREVIKQVGGSLLVAVLAYLLMINGYVKHLTFNFPELELVLLGLILMLGQYNGYRLSELRRFRPMVEER